jgi:hypothetical protein
MDQKQGTKQKKRATIQRPPVQLSVSAEDVRRLVAKLKGEDVKE